MKYMINYTEIFTGQIEVEAESKELANDKVCDMIDSDSLIPSKQYDGHEITVDFVKEVKDAEQ